MKNTFLIFSLSLMSSFVFGQKWQVDTLENRDTITKIYTYLLNDTTYTITGDSGMYQVYQYIKGEYNNQLISEAFFDCKHQPMHNYFSNYHKKVRFEKGFFSNYFKYYDKNGKQLRRVEVDVIWEEFSDVSLKVFEYDRRGNLVSLSFFKTQDFDYETFETLDEPILIPTGKAYFEANVHKYVWKIKKRKGLLIQQIYDTFGELVEEKKFELE